jgi:uncharacterized membrane protein YozB (DUF420 family)
VVALPHGMADTAAAAMASALSHVHRRPRDDHDGAASVASFLAAVFTEIYLCNVCSYQEILRRNGRG